MTAASAAMAKAVVSLTSLDTRAALPSEMDALTNLLKAQGEVKRREVPRQQQAGAGAGDTNRNYNLSSLLDKRTAADPEDQLREQVPSPSRNPRTRGTRAHSIASKGSPGARTSSSSASRRLPAIATPGTATPQTRARRADASGERTTAAGQDLAGQPGASGGADADP